MFKSQGSETPDGVLKAIENETALNTSSGLGEVTVEKGCGPELPMNNRMCFVTVTLKRTQAKTAATPGTHDSRQACRAVIARDLNYPKAAIKGGDRLIDEGDFKQYIFEGKDNDILFCQMPGDGSYVIRAALKKQFPVREMSRGRF